MARCFSSAVVKGLFLAITVGGGRSALRRECDQGIRPGRFDPRKTAAERARRHRPLHVLGEGIVATGIENDEAQLLGRLDRLQNPVQRDRFVISVGVALKHGIHGDQIVGSVDLDAVAGIIDHRDIRIARLLGEVAQRPPHLGIFQIAPGFHDVEGSLPEHLGDGRRIVGRIGERHDVLIARIADDERHALFR